uniref:Secreted protein n=1 Tax=Arundo donax TaxID=35708 RepID=A0A0A9EFV8_ARUDO
MITLIMHMCLGCLCCCCSHQQHFLPSPTIFLLLFLQQYFLPSFLYSLLSLSSPSFGWPLPQVYAWEGWQGSQQHIVRGTDGIFIGSADHCV